MTWGDKQKTRDLPGNKTARGESDSPGKGDNQTARTNPSGTLGWGWRVGHGRRKGFWAPWRSLRSERDRALPPFGAVCA